MVYVSIGIVIKSNNFFLHVLSFYCLYTSMEMYMDFFHLLLSIQSSSDIPIHVISALLWEKLTSINTRSL
jgi:hypothetical protein